MSLGLWKIFASLGVPGIALGVFYMLFRKFNWQFPRVPAKWVGPIIVLFMLLTAGLIFHVLNLWAPEKDLKEGKEGSTIQGSKVSQYASAMHRDSTDFTTSQSNRESIHTGIDRDRIEELVSILDLRAERMVRDLSKYYQYVEVNKYIRKFQELHANHKAALLEGKIVQAHEILGEIQRLSFELEKEEFWTRHRRETPTFRDSFQSSLVKRSLRNGITCC